MINNNFLKTKMDIRIEIYLKYGNYSFCLDLKQYWMHAICGLSPLDRNNESVKNYLKQTST